MLPESKLGLLRILVPGLKKMRRQPVLKLVFASLTSTAVGCEI
jgi:hypothetical protein